MSRERGDDDRGTLLGLVDIVSQFEPDDLEFVDDSLRRYSLYVRRDHTYLNWRFMRNPTSTYAAFVCRGATGRGYAVAKIFMKGSAPECDLVDLVAENHVAIQSLLRSVHAYANEHSAIRVNTWLNRNSPLFLHLERFGYVHTSPVNWLGYLPLSPKVSTDSVRSYDSWFLTMGDSDVY